MNKDDLEKILAQSSSSAQARIDQIDQRIREYRRDSVQNQREWRNFIVTVSFAVMSIFAAIFSRDLLSISLESMSGFFLLLGNGVLLSIKVKHTIEQDDHNLQTWGLEEIHQNWKIKEAVWNYKTSPSSENYNKLVEANKPPRIQTSAQQPNGVDYSNDVAIILLVIGVYLLFHEFILKLTRSQSLYFAILLFITLGLIMNAYIDGRKLKAKISKRQRYVQDESNMRDRYVTQLEKKKVQK